MHSDHHAISYLHADYNRYRCYYPGTSDTYAYWHTYASETKEYIGVYIRLGNICNDCGGDSGLFLATGHDGRLVFDRITNFNDWARRRERFRVYCVIFFNVDSGRSQYWYCVCVHPNIEADSKEDSSNSA